MPTNSLVQSSPKVQLTQSNEFTMGATKFTLDVYIPDHVLVRLPRHVLDETRLLAGNSLPEALRALSHSTKEIGKLDV